MLLTLCLYCSTHRLTCYRTCLDTHSPNMCLVFLFFCLFCCSNLIQGFRGTSKDIVFLWQGIFLLSKKLLPVYHKKLLHREIGSYFLLRSDAIPLSLAPNKNLNWWCIIWQVIHSPISARLHIKWPKVCCCSKNFLTNLGILQWLEIGEDFFSHPQNKKVYYKQNIW